MRRITKKRQTQYGGVTVALTLLVVAATVIVNVLFSSLCQRYEIYVNMNKSFTYDLTDDCRDYIKQYVISELDRQRSEGEHGKAKFIFWDDRENIESEAIKQMVLNSATEILNSFPDYLEIEFIDMLENPSLARKYGVTASTDVVFVCEDRHNVMQLPSFYIFNSSDTSTPIAYNGERRLATGLYRTVRKNTGMCYLTINHGETLNDSSFLTLIADGGYNYTYLDLLNSDIPDDCELLVTYNPTQDFTASDNVSSVSEVEKISRYMDRGGNYMVFVSADTFAAGSHVNFENLMSEWGVNFVHSSSDDGSEACYNIKDPAHSTTVDGYTILARGASSGKGANIVSGVDKSNLFGNSACITAADGYISDGDGNFVSGTGKKRVFSPLVVSYSSAQAWAAGRAVERAGEAGFTLMSLTEQENTEGTNSHLVVCASTYFGSEAALKSTVFGNTETIYSIMKHMGNESVPEKLTFKPFSVTKIASITTATSTRITVVLSVVPAVALIFAGVFVLVKRKNTI